MGQAGAIDRKQKVGVARGQEIGPMLQESEALRSPGFGQGRAGMGRVPIPSAFRGESGPYGDRYPYRTRGREVTVDLWPIYRS